MKLTTTEEDRKGENVLGEEEKKKRLSLAARKQRIQLSKVTEKSQGDTVSQDYQATRPVCTGGGEGGRSGEVSRKNKWTQKKIERPTDVLKCFQKPVDRKDTLRCITHLESLFEQKNQLASDSTKWGVVTGPPPQEPGETWTEKGQQQRKEII